MERREQGKADGEAAGRPAGRLLRVFHSEVVDRLRAAGDCWELPRGTLLLPKVFGFCRGVKRALAMLQQAVADHRPGGRRLVLLGEVIHNPWVNQYFARQGVAILEPADREDLEHHLSANDCAVIPAFGVPLPIERRLRAIGCEIVDTTCGDVRRLWAWAEGAVRRGCGVLIYGRARHDETVVTKSRLGAAGGSYLVTGNCRQVDRFCELIRGDRPTEEFRRLFDEQATNSTDLSPFAHLAQVSQTTMLYTETMEVRRRLTDAFSARFGPQAAQRLSFQPTVCRATQDRQAAAVELCRRGCDLMVVIGGFGSSNTRHLFELARHYAPTYFIEDAAGILPDGSLRAMDPAADRPVIVADWLPHAGRPAVGVLAGASTPETAVGEVLEKLAALLS